MIKNTGAGKYAALAVLLLWGVVFDSWALDIEKAGHQFARTAFSLADVSEVSYEDAPAIGVTFTVPLAEGFEPYLNVSVKNGMQVEGGWILSESRTTAYFTHIEAEKRYTVNVYRGIKSITGKALGDSSQKEIKTRAVKAGVSFADRGSVLPVKSSKGLPLYTVNVDTVDVDFHRVKSDKIGRFMNHWYKNQSQGSWQLKRYQPFLELVHSGRFDLNPPRNKRYRANLPVKEIAALQGPGLYLAVMKPAGTYPSNYQVTYFVVSDIGLHARFYRDRLDLYATSIEDAAPLSGVRMTVLNRGGVVKAQQSSSPEGLSTFHNLSSDAFVLLAQKGDHLALLELSGPALDLSAFELGRRLQRATEAYLYGPRDLYRPGEKVIFNALLRNGDGRRAPNTPLKAVLRGADNRVAQSTIWHGDDLSYYYHEYQLPPDAATGEWNLRLKIGSTVVGEYRFRVEEFLPERMKLALAGGVRDAQFIKASTNELQVPVEGAYLYGAPASGNRLGVLVTAASQRHPIETFKDYQFGNVDESNPTARLELPDIKLDSDGRGLIKLQNPWKSLRSPMDIFVVGSLYEAGGRPVVRGVHYTTWPGDALVGIRPVFKEDELRGNSQAEFEIIKSDREGRLRTAKGLEVKLVRERRNYFWSYSDGRGWTRSHTDNHYTVFGGNVDIGGETKRATVRVPVEWGGYRLEIRDPDSGLVSSVRFRAGWWYGDGGDGSSARPDRVELKLDKRAYRNGDTARVTLHAPYAGKGYLFVEGDKPLHWQPIEVPAGGTTVEIPVDDAWQRHDLYFSAVVFRPSESLSGQMPNRAVGLLHLPLDREERKLDVALLPPAEKVAPETTLRTRIKVSGVDNREGTAMVTLAAVDVGVLNITDFETPDAHKWFFEQRRYAVDSRDMYGAIIDSLEGDMARQRFGGDADLSRGGKKAQSDVRIVSLFSKAVRLDSQGEAEIPFELPDFNGRIRLMALAFNGDEYGKAETEITVAAPVVAEISMPRFLANGDRSTVTLELHNLSGEEQALKVNAHAGDPLVLEAETKEITLADGEKKRLTYPLGSRDTFGMGDLFVEVTNGAEEESARINMKRHWRLAVRPAYPAVTRAIRKVLAKGESFQLSGELENLIIETVEAEFGIDSMPPIALNDHLRYLLTYPYGCLEQSTSSTYPWLFATGENVDRLGLDKITGDRVRLDKRPEYLEKGLDRLRNLQLRSGGFGLWSGAGDEQHWLTAYVADFLTDARNRAVPVDSAMFDRVMGRLLQYVNTNNGMFGERWSEDLAHYRLAYRAYAAYVLSKLNRAPLGSLRTLYEQHRNDAKTGLPLLHLGLALIKQGDKQRGMAAVEQALQMPVNENRYVYYGDYGSSGRDLALMIYLLESEDVEVPGRAGLPFKLADAVGDRNYMSTQERIALFKAGIALAKNGNRAWSGELSIGSASQEVNETGPLRRLLGGKQLAQGFGFTSHYGEKLFARMAVSGYPATAPEPGDNGIWIEREYYDIDGNLLARSGEEGRRSLPPLKSGDLVLVHLRVNANRRIPDALVVDLLPAGFELENQNLKHAVKLDRFLIDGKPLDRLRSADLKHQEYRDDRYVAAFDLRERGHTDLFYLARAVTPGTYTVPSAYVEDMYRPFLHGVSHSISELTIVNASTDEQ